MVMADAVWRRRDGRCRRFATIIGWSVIHGRDAASRRRDGRGRRFATTTGWSSLRVQVKCGCTVHGSWGPGSTGGHRFCPAQGYFVPTLVREGAAATNVAGARPARPARTRPAQPARTCDRRDRRGRDWRDRRWRDGDTHQLGRGSMKAHLAYVRMRRAEAAAAVAAAEQPPSCPACRGKKRAHTCGKGLKMPRAAPGTALRRRHGSATARTPAAMMMMTTALAPTA